MLFKKCYNNHELLVVTETHRYRGLAYEVDKFQVRSQVLSGLGKRIKVFERGEVIKLITEGKKLLERTGTVVSHIK